MGNLMGTVAQAWQTFLNLARQFTFKDAIDVAIVTALLYGIIKLVRETRAGQLVKGIILLVVLFLLSSTEALNFLMLNQLLRYFFQSAFIIVVILFQPEIRKALEQVGHSKVWSVSGVINGKDRDVDKLATRRAIAGVVGAVGILQQLRMGALIVFERRTKLGEIAETGTIVEAEPSAQLIGNIFFNKAPLHDGGMIIREGRVHAAGCILPLTSNDNVSAELGTRHRAALGMSENSDAVVVVVSEETAQISIAVGGRLTRDYTRAALSEALEKYLIGPEGKNASGGKRILGKLGFGAGRKGG